MEALNLPGPLKDSPFSLQTPQVWDAFDGRKSKGKPGFLSTNVNAMSVKSVLIMVGPMQQGISMN
eukprot:12921395-Prorocentrum_lima.AAC.1